MKRLSTLKKAGSVNWRSNDAFSVIVQFMTDKDSYTSAEMRGIRAVARGRFIVELAAYAEYDSEGKGDLAKTMLERALAGIRDFSNEYEIEVVAAIMSVTRYGKDGKPTTHDYDLKASLTELRRSLTTA